MGTMVPEGARVIVSLALLGLDMDVDDIAAHEPTGQLLATWIAKEELRSLLALARTRPARSDISNQLFRFYDWCRRADVSEVTVLAQTIEAWWPQILRSWAPGSPTPPPKAPSD